MLALMLVLLASGCEANKPDGEVQPVFTRMAAQLQGTVTYEDGCMKINADAPNGGNTLVWPLDQYSVEIKSDRVVFEDLTPSDTSGEWIFGTHIMIGGGESGIGPPHITPDFPHLPIPDHCTGKLWIIGDAN
jgi:hypothetical protein